MWEVLNTCERQLRVAGMGKPFALDYAAVMAVGAALGADVTLLAEVLPAAETAILSKFDADPE